MARPQQDLVKIGLEGFDLIDTFYPPTRRSSTNGGFMTARQRQGQGRSHDHNKEEPAINSEDAAFKYGGISVVKYPKTKPKSFWGKLFFKP